MNILTGDDANYWFGLQGTGVACSDATDCLGKVEWVSGPTPMTVWPAGYWFQVDAAAGCFTSNIRADSMDVMGWAASECGAGGRQAIPLCEFECQEGECRIA